MLVVVVALFFVTCAAKRQLPPGALNMGYASGCDHDKITTAVETGLNVLFWFSIDLGADSQGRPAISPNQAQPLSNITCVVEVARTLRAKGLFTTHMVTVGGWNAAHPVTMFPAADMYEAWKSWNLEVDSLDLPGGFDGIDWDVEGDDDPSSPKNQLPLELLNLIGEMSQMAQRDDFIVSMVPAESYLDPTTPHFDGSLLHPYPEWEPRISFNYHGHNAYAYLLAKFPNTTLPSGDTVDTFDLVSVQFYESYSHLAFNTTIERQQSADYLVGIVRALTEGWWVDFESAPEFSLPSQRVAVRPSALCIGLSNGWADNNKSVLVRHRQHIRTASKLIQLPSMREGI